MNLSANFSLAEMVKSAYAIRRGINNMPDDAEVLENLHALANNMERVRAVFGKPITVSSGYRSPKVNTAVGGSKNSYHMKGLACDFTVAGMSPRDTCRVLEDKADEVGYRTLIAEGGWVHIDFPDVGEEATGKVLTAVFLPDAPVRYVKGIA